MRDRRLFAFLEVNVPDVTIDQGNNEGGAQKHDRGPEMNAPRCLHAINSERHIKRQREAKELIKKAELNIGAALEKASDAQRDHEGADKRDNRECGSLGIEREGK